MIKDDLMALMKLKEICSKIGSGATPKGGKEAYLDSGISLIRSQNVLDYSFSYSGLAHINEEQAERLSNVIVEKGDLLLNITGDSVARVCKVDESVLPARVNQHVAIIRVNEEYALGSYLLCYLQKIKPLLIQLASGGATRNALTKGMIENLEIDIPSLTIQHRIVSVFDDVQKKIAINSAINQNLSQQLRLIFQHIFFDEEHPEWPVEKLGSFLSLERGLSYKGKFLSDSEGVPMVNLGNILPNSVFRPEKLKFYTGDFKAKVIVKPGDIVVANTDLTQAREVLGSAIFIPDLGYPTIICSHHISIVRDCRISKYFIHGMLNSPSYRERVVGFATGTTVLALPSETILNCEFALPPNELIVEYDAIAESFYQKSEQLRKENQQLIQIRDTLLPQLMSGQLDVSEVPL